jgi:hypothetical protein
MNTINIVFELVELAIALAQTLGDGTIQGDAEVARTLQDIIDKGVQAYRDHTGAPLDPNLIDPETAV